MGFANSGMSNLAPSFWAKEAERSLFVDNKAMAIANTTLRNLVAGEGATVYKTILSYPASTTYTPGNDITTVALTGSSESLSVDTYLASLVTIDDTEKKQSVISLGEMCAQRMMNDHKNRVEQAVLAEVTNAKWSLDDGSVGGTSGNNIALDTTKVPKVFIAADAKLDGIDAPKAGRTAVVGGHFLGLLKLQQAGRETAFGDGVNTRGVVANVFGWDILYSNNLPYTAVLTIATQPLDGDTIHIAGVLFTFKDTLGTTAGNLKIGTAVTDTVANLVVALNALGTSITSSATAGYAKISAEDAFLLRDKRRILATATSASVTTLTGYGDIVVSETLTAEADIWSGRRQDSLFCVRGCVDIVVQFPPQVEVCRDQDQFADIVKSLVGFGKKTYADGTREMVQVKMDASTSDWA